jgi:hypothetical protein
LTLTPLVVKDLPRGAGEKVVKKYLAKSDVIAKWDQTAWAQKIATRKTRASLSDFDRFKVQKFKSQVSILQSHSCIHLSDRLTNYFVFLPPPPSCSVVMPSVLPLLKPRSKLLKQSSLVSNLPCMLYFDQLYIVTAINTLLSNEKVQTG